MAHALHATTFTGNIRSLGFDRGTIPWLCAASQPDRHELPFVSVGDRCHRGSLRHPSRPRLAEQGSFPRESQLAAVLSACDVLIVETVRELDGRCQRSHHAHWAALPLCPAQRIYRNWEHEFDFNPKEYVTPASLDEIVAVVKRAVAEKRTIKVRLEIALLQASPLSRLLGTATAGRTSPFPRTFRCR
jgi:hypothetical protein